MVGTGEEPTTKKDNVVTEGEQDTNDVTEIVESANQQWAEYYDNSHKSEEEEDAKVEELHRVIAEAKTEEKRLLQLISRHKEYIAQFMASFSSVAKDE